VIAEFEHELVYSEASVVVVACFLIVMLYAVLVSRWVVKEPAAYSAVDKCPEGRPFVKLHHCLLAVPAPALVLCSSLASAD
jgi:hypothetical protein